MKHYKDMVRPALFGFAGFALIGAAVVYAEGALPEDESPAGCEAALSAGKAAEAGEKGLFELAVQATHHVSRFAGEQVDMTRVRQDLEFLTGETPLPTDHALLPDRATEENRERTRGFIRARLRELGYEVKEEKFASSSYSSSDYDDEGEGEDDSHYSSWFSSSSSSKGKSSSSSSKPPGPAVNIIAELAGTKNPDQVVEISAHYDTVYRDVPGADDNGSGLTSALELARVFKQFAPERTIRFVLSDLEERGQQGSRYHVAELKNDPRTLVGALVIDMIGYSPKANGGEFVLEIGQLYQYDSGAARTAAQANAASREMAEAVLYQFHRYTGRTVVIKPLTYGSEPGTGDHGPYWSGGYPALFAAAPFDGEAVNPHYHKQTDVIEHIQWPYFEGILRAMTEGVACLTGSQLACEAQQKIFDELKPQYDAIAAAEVLPQTSRVPEDKRPYSSSSYYSYGSGSSWSFGSGGSGYGSKRELPDFLTESQALEYVEDLTAMSNVRNEQAEDALIAAKPRYPSVALALIEVLGSRYMSDVRRAQRILETVKFLHTPDLEPALYTVGSEAAHDLLDLIDEWTLTPEQYAKLEAERGKLTESQAYEMVAKLKSPSSQDKAADKLIAAKPTDEDVILGIIDVLWASFSSDRAAAERVLDNIGIPNTPEIRSAVDRVANSTDSNRARVGRKFQEKLREERGAPPAAVAETTAPAAPANRGPALSDADALKLVGKVENGLISRRGATNKLKAAAASLSPRVLITLAERLQTAPSSEAANAIASVLLEASPFGPGGAPNPRLPASDVQVIREAIELAQKDRFTAYRRAAAERLLSTLEGGGVK